MDFEDKRSMAEKVGSWISNVYKATSKVWETVWEAMTPETIKAWLDPERDVEASDFAWDSLYLLPFVRPLGKAIKWAFTAGKTAKNTRAWKIAWDIAETKKKTIFWKETVDPSKMNVSQKWKMVVDWDKWIIKWTTPDWKPLNKKFADTTVGDLQKLNKDVLPKEKTIINWLVDKFKWYAWKVNKEKFISIVKNNPKKILWVAAITLLTTMLWWDEEDDKVVDKDIKETIDEKEKEIDTQLKDQEDKEKMITGLQWAVEDNNPALIWGKLPHRLFSDELWIRWKTESRDTVDKYFEDMWIDFVWEKWTSTRNIWIANAIAWLKHADPEEFKKLLDHIKKWAVEESINL